MPSGVALDLWGPGGGDGGHSAYVSTRAGTVFHLDTRVKGAAVGAIKAHDDKKITAVSLQAGGARLATACADATVKIWDARKLPRHVPSGARGKALEPVAVLAHGLGVTGAAWSPTGRFLASVSNDNKIRVWTAEAAGGDGDGAAPADPPFASMTHNNHTGRWLAPFKLSWDPASEGTIVIGDMTRAIKLLAVTTDVPPAAAAVARGARGAVTLAAALSAPLLSAVPTQTAVHPTLNMAVGGTASGRVYLFK
jgi:WD repeat-containing protein 76